MFFLETDHTWKKKTSETEVDRCHLFYQKTNSVAKNWDKRQKSIMNNIRFQNEIGSAITKYKPAKYATRMGVRNLKSNEIGKRIGYPAIFKDYF